MKLDGIHHITAITENGQRNVDFYAGVMGMRLVKKSINQDNPSVYHLFYADESGDPGSDLTFFEYPGVPEGRVGDGMVHRIVWRVASADALDFWAQRLEQNGIDSRRLDERPSLLFADPEGLEHELSVVETEDAPLVAEHPEIPAELALQGFDGVAAYTSDPVRSAALLGDTLGFELREEREGGALWEARGPSRGSMYAYHEPPEERGLQGAGTIHHVAWASSIEEHEAWQRRVAESGARPTDVIDRFYFRSIYFREPSGVLFEIATIGPGFTVDEPAETLGDKISIPPFLEHMRDEIEPNLRPIVNPRTLAASKPGS